MFLNLALFFAEAVSLQRRASPTTESIVPSDCNRGGSTRDTRFDYVPFFLALRQYASSTRY